MLGLGGEEAPQIGGPYLDKRRESLLAQELDAGAHVALVCPARVLRQTALDAAIDDEVGQRIEHGTSLRAGPSSLSRPV